MLAKGQGGIQLSVVYGLLKLNPSDSRVYKTDTDCVNL